MTLICLKDRAILSKPFFILIKLATLFMPNIFSFSNEYINVLELHFLWLKIFVLIHESLSEMFIQKEPFSQIHTDLLLSIWAIGVNLSDPKSPFIFVSEINGNKKNSIYENYNLQPDSTKGPIHKLFKEYSSYLGYT